MNYIKYISPWIVLCCVIVFCSAPEGLKSGYQIENDKVYHYSGFPATKTLVQNADPKSFRDINKDYGKDNKGVYCGHILIADADPETFEYLGGPYSKDKNKGYFQEKVLSNDGARFSVIPDSAGSVYARDGQNVYRSNSIVEGADPSSFRFVPMFNGNYLTVDKDNIYFHDLPIDSAEGSSFAKVNGHYFKDANKVWALILGRETYWKTITDADAVSFQALKEYYAKDKRGIYYEDKLVEDADMLTFEETANGEGQDKNGKFDDGKRKSDK